VAIRINGTEVPAPTEHRVSLLDFLREQSDLQGTKKGCNQGACGACTVLADGHRILSCLALAVQYEGRWITTIDSLADGDPLHPLQQAFIEYDGLQCGYCTPGQICSAIGMAEEVRRGVPSYVTDDLAAGVRTASAKSASPVSAPRSPTRSTTRRADAFANCRSRWISSSHEGV
jgi:xanthine dehydrogenase YagT iron-sulfur-binding subunit